MNIFIDGKAGAKIGNLQVFTTEGAINAYKNFVRLFQRDMSLAASCILSSASDDMYSLGFSWDELEQIENEIFSEG